MVFWIITGLIAVIAIRYLVVERREGGYLDLGDWFFTGLLSFLAWFIVAGVMLSGISTGLGATSTETETHKLQAIGTDSQTGGTFFLGSGTLKEESVISYITVGYDGSFTPQQVATDRVKIFESEDVEPEVEVVKGVYEHRWLTPLPPLSPKVTYQFTIPEGSVANTYSVEP